MAQPQAQRYLFFQLGVIGLGSLHLKKKRKKSTFLFFLAPHVIEIHQASGALKRQTWVRHEAVTWTLFCGMNQAPMAAFESFRNAPGPQRGVMKKADATDKILRLKFQTERIKVTSKTQQLMGEKKGVELGGRVLSI